jgi:hypothetical protein
MSSAWEYKKVELNSEGIATLNSLGAQGWRVKTVIRELGGHWALMERWGGSANSKPVSYRDELGEVDDL